MENRPIHLFAPGLPWPLADLDLHPHINAATHDGVFSLMIAIELTKACAQLAGVLGSGLYSVGITVDPPHLSVVITDQFILAKYAIGEDAKQLTDLARQIRLAKSRRVLVAPVRNGIVVKLIEKSTSKAFWRHLGKLAKNPQRDPFWEDAAQNLIWPVTRDPQPVFDSDGYWRAKGWRP